MTYSKNQLIDLLVEADLERFYDNDDPAKLYAYVLRKGVVGYENYTYEQLLDEALDLELIEQ